MITLSFNPEEVEYILQALGYRIRAIEKTLCTEQLSHDEYSYTFEKLTSYRALRKKLNDELCGTSSTGYAAEKTNAND